MNRNVTRLAHFIAYLGGLVLLALIALTCLSIVGRMTNNIMHVCHCHSTLQPSPLRQQNRVSPNLLLLMA